MTDQPQRVLRSDSVIYVMPYRENGRRVVYRQDPQTFKTTRETVDPLRGRRLASKGRDVELHETPAWCDPRAPRDSSSLTAP